MCVSFHTYIPRYTSIHRSRNEIYIYIYTLIITRVGLRKGVWVSEWECGFRPMLYYIPTAASVVVVVVEVPTKLRRIVCHRKWPGVLNYSNVEASDAVVLLAPITKHYGYWAGFIYICMCVCVYDMLALWWWSTIYLLFVAFQTKIRFFFIMFYFRYYENLCKNTNLFSWCLTQ